MKIITISREFGSGGRELGKRLADRLGCAYYDREIVTAIAQHSQLHEEYVASVLEKPVLNYPITFGRTFASPVLLQSSATKVLVAQQQILKEVAQRGEDCVIVGRCADVILREYQPLNLFVYADLPSKGQRCMDRAPEGENLTQRELERMMKQIDSGRAKSRDLLTGGKWVAKECYHLCVITSGQSIKAMVPWVEGYVHYWFGRDGQ